MTLYHCQKQDHPIRYREIEYFLYYISPHMILFQISDTTLLIIIGSNILLNHRNLVHRVIGTLTYRPIELLTSTFQHIGPLNYWYIFISHTQGIDSLGFHLINSLGPQLMDSLEHWDFRSLGSQNICTSKYWAIGTSKSWVLGTLRSWVMITQGSQTIRKSESYIICTSGSQDIGYEIN